MTPDPAFADLMERLRAGDSAAAGEVFQRFAQRLIGLARSRLDSQLRQKLDPEDVMQSVFRSFFRRQADGALHAENWDRLWSLLAVITLRKCGHKAEFFHAGVRDVRREGTGPAADPSLALCQAIAREPRPEEVAMLTETVERLLRSLEPRDRTILEQTLQGASVAEVSRRVGFSQRTVERVLDRVRLKLERLRADDAPG
jgi:RNA polymerase sigma-70 factor (ECF subfamily)